jgi:hypothetical protein
LEGFRGGESVFKDVVKAGGSEGARVGGRAGNKVVGVQRRALKEERRGQRNGGEMGRVGVWSWVDARCINRIFMIIRDPARNESECETDPARFPATIGVILGIQLPGSTPRQLRFISRCSLLKKYGSMNVKTNVAACRLQRIRLIQEWTSCQLVDALDSVKKIEIK